MNLQEAIQHCFEKSQGCDDCAQEHRQLAEWLIELLEYRECDVDILRDGIGMPEPSSLFAEQ